MIEIRNADTGEPIGCIPSDAPLPPAAIFTCPVVVSVYPLPDVPLEDYRAIATRESLETDSE